MPSFDIFFFESLKSLPFLNFSYWNGVVPDDCARRNPTEKWKCYFGEHVYRTDSKSPKPSEYNFKFGPRGFPTFALGALNDFTKSNSVFFCCFFAIKVNASNERRFDRSTVIFKFGVRIKLHV